MSRPLRSARGAFRPLFTVAVCACSTAAADHRQPGAPDAGPPCKVYAACTLLTPSDVAGALGLAAGRTVDPGAPEAMNPSITTSAPEQVGCDYVVDGAVVRFALTCDSQGILPRNYPDQFTNVDLGDQAYWQDLTPDGGAPAGKLAVWTGQHVELDFTLTPPADGSFSVDPMAAAEQMARAVIPLL